MPRRYLKKPSAIFGISLIAFMLIAADCGGSKPPLPESDIVSLEITPSALLFSAQGEEAMLRVTAYDARGNEIDVSDQQLEWQNSDSGIVQFNQENGQTIQVKSVSALGSSIISVKTVNGLLSAPVTATVAKVKDGVTLVADQQVVFPTVDIPRLATPQTFNLPHVSSSQGVTQIAGFSLDEYAAMFEITPEGNVRYGLITENLDAKQGDLLLASGGSGVLGRVLQVEERDGFSLLQLEQLALQDVFAQLKFDFDDEALKKIGIVNDDSLRQLIMSPQQAADLTALASRPSCKLAGSFTLANVNLPALQVSFDPLVGGSIDLEAETFSFVVGLQIGLKLEPGFEIQPGVLGNLTCELEDPTEFEAPLPGPLGLVASAKGQAQAQFIADANFSAGPRIAGKATLAATFLLQAGYDNRLADPNISKAELSPTMDGNFTAEFSLIEDAKAQLSAGLFETAKAGIQLGGKLASSLGKAASFLDSIGLGVVSDITDALFLDVLNAKAGPQASFIWESPKRVLNNEDSAADLALNVIFDATLENDGLNTLLKKYRIAPVTFSLAKATVNLGRFHRVFAKQSVRVKSPCFDGLVYDLDSKVSNVACVVKGQDATFTVKVDYKGTITGLDRPLTKGDVWLAKEKKLADMDANATSKTLTLTLKITDEICQAGLIHFLAYNDMIFLLETAGYAGQAQLSCASNEAPVASEDNASTERNTAVLINVLANDSDPDGDALSVNAVSQPTRGTAAITGQSVTYTPDDNFTGVDSFTYTVQDARGASAVAPVTVTVVDTTNRQPTATDDSAETANGEPVTIQVLNNDSDPDNDGLSIERISQQASNGVATITGTSIIYTPNPTFLGIDSFNYRIQDGRGGTAEAKVTIVVFATVASCDTFKGAFLVQPSNIEMNDPAGHAPFIGDPLGNALQFAINGTTVVSAPAPFVAVSGGGLTKEAGNMCGFSATGTGTVAGNADIVVTLNGTLNPESGNASLTYSMGVEGGLPTGQAIDYFFDGVFEAVP